MKSLDWRRDSTIKMINIYKKSFALIPKYDEQKRLIWMKFYYKWYECCRQDDMNFHRRFIGNISSDEYIIVRLKGEVND